MLEVFRETADSEIEDFSQMVVRFVQLSCWVWRNLLFSPVSFIS